MKRARLRAACVFLVAVGPAILLVHGHSRGQEQVDLETFLIDKLDFGRKEFDDLALGEVVVKLGHRDDHELGIASVSRIDVPKDFLLERYQQLVGLRERKGVLQANKVSNPPTRDDFGRLRFPDEDLKDLKNSKEGDSDIKMTVEWLRRVQEEIDWSSDTNVSDANHLLQQLLLERTNDYLRGGLDALHPYVDKEEPQSVRDGMKKIIGDAPRLFEYVPELHDYLQRFPDGAPDVTTEFVYWTLEEFGAKPTLSLNHVVIYDQPAGRPSDVLIAQVGFYASHYFQATLGVIGIVEAQIANEEPANYFVLLQRYWFDGKLKGVKRKMMHKNLGKGMKEMLEEQKERVIAAYGK